MLRAHRAHATAPRLAPTDQSSRRVRLRRANQLEPVRRPCPASVRRRRAPPPDLGCELAGHARQLRRRPAALQRPAVRNVPRTRHAEPWQPAPGPAANQAPDRPRQMPATRPDVPPPGPERSSSFARRSRPKATMTHTRRVTHHTTVDMSGERPRSYVVPQTGEPTQPPVDWHAPARENRTASGQARMRWSGWQTS